jgi:hypothetical protein
MTAIPTWVTPAGSLGTIPEGIFYSVPLISVTDIRFIPTSISSTGSKVTMTFPSTVAVSNNPDSVVANGYSVTMTFPTQSFVLFPVGSTISVSGFNPSGYNGTFVVTNSSTNSVTFANNTINEVASYGSITSLSTPFPIGSKITIDGFDPAGYNGVFTVIDASTNFISFTNTTTTPVTTYGSITFAVYYQLLAGRLPPGMQINETGILAGSPSVNTVQGVPLPVPADTTSQFAVRSYTERVIKGVTQLNTLADRTFSITVSGLNTVIWNTPAGSIGTYFDGSQITDLTVSYTNPDPFVGAEVTLIAGALPTGLTVSNAGVISGYITPNANSNATSTNYSFTLRVSNGVSNDTRTFSILVYARSTMTADNTHVTADNTFITADIAPITPPIITTPTGSIGSTRSDNFYAFQFTGIDFAGNPIEFIATTALPPGLTLDPTSGWLYGYIPYEGIMSSDYTFSIIAREVDDTSNTSKLYTYSLTITGPINSDIVWLTPSFLGSIDNGATSTLYVKATNVSGVPLQYRLLSGSDSRLPQGLQLLSSGNIAGRVSFDTFALDGGTTTFDVGLNTVDQPTTFDMVATFTVNAYSVNGLINVTKTFSIRVIRRYNEPYDNLYIQAMPPQNDRDLLASLLQNPTIFPPELIYRNDDPNFGVSHVPIYNHAYGLTAATYDDYVASMNLNHYWKNLILGEIKTAQALDDLGNVIYEVVYSEVVDTLVNNDGISVGKQVVLPFPINGPDSTEIATVYPNSLQDMRDQVIDIVGQISNVLPRWMLSRQVDGTVLGFTPAWVIAYTNPGQSGQIAYNIKTQFGTRLNLVDFKADRYELDNLLTKNWDRETQQWRPHPPTLTTFDVNLRENIDQWINNNNNSINWINNSYAIVGWENSYNGQPTVFDGNSLQFISPVDMYSNTTEYDKYLVFPKQNILE